jgi:hypothetical protein
MPETTFWELYYGPLALVDDENVEVAMVEFGRCVQGDCVPDKMKGLSLALAQACR